MKKFMLAALLMLPTLGLIGCQDAETQREVATLKQQVAALQDENARLSGQIDGIQPGEDGKPLDMSTLIIRLDKQDRELAAAKARLADLETAPAKSALKIEGEMPEGEVAVDDEDYAKFKAMADRDRAERDAERQKAQEERRATQMAEAKKMADKYGFEFDEADPRGSIMKIMSDPVQRAKAMEAMRTEMTERRLEPLNLGEYEKSEVLRIEGETRDKIRETMTNARESGMTQEEIQAEVKQIQDDQKLELERVMTPEQMEEYEKSGAGMGGMIPGAGDLGGMIPGFGGGGGFGGGR
ncbi:MAG: hypothetical protein K8I27_12225 [Planctomycetes bacterium]|nr:hypothetical protein [Planctomycetota bacterium]